MLASWHGFFGWYGWPALVAIGTLALAVVTVWLGWLAKKQAGDAWAREWAAQRPEVYPLLVREWVHGLERYGPVRLSVLPLKNGGRGPAIDVEGEITAVSADGTQYERKIIAGTIAPGDVLDARVAPAPVEKWQTVSGVLRYRDLADGLYESRFEFSAAEGGELAVTTLPTVNKPAGQPPYEGSQHRQR